MPRRHGRIVPPADGHQFRQVRPAALRPWAIPTLGEWALNPSPSPAIFVAALTIR